MKYKTFMPRFAVCMIVALTIGIVSCFMFLHISKKVNVIDVGSVKWVYCGIDSSGREKSKITHQGRVIVESNVGLNAFLALPYIYVVWFKDDNEVGEYAKIDSRNGHLSSVNGETIAKVVKGKRFMRFREFQRSLKMTGR